MYVGDKYHSTYFSISFQHALSKPPEKEYIRPSRDPNPNHCNDILFVTCTMARGRNNNRTSHGDGGGAIHSANMAINKENDFKEGVKKLQNRATMTAELLTEGGEIETFFMEADPDNAEGFLLAQRNRLKAIAEGNAKQWDEIENFVQAVKYVRGDVQRQNQSGAAAGGEGEAAAAGADEAPDYERSIQEAVEKVRLGKESDPNHVPLEEHEMVMSLREKLGEKVKKRARNDDYDDL